jgi:hypothetical protein
MAMLTADAGAVWGKRADMTTATDAAALAAARDYATGGDGCTSATEVLDANSEGSQLELCVPSGIGGGGHVLVQAHSAPVEMAFAALFGFGDQEVRSASVARWGSPRTATGLRPIGVCVEHPHVQQWLGLASAGGVVPSPGVRRVEFTKDSPNACGADAPGNWGWLDFDEGSDGTPDLRTWLLDGYAGPVGVDDCNGDGTPGDGCHAIPGSRALGIGPELDQLVRDGTEFGVVIYDSVTDSGSNVRYRVYGFLGVVLRGYLATGAEHARYFDFEFRELVLAGECCDAGGPTSGAVTLSLCAVDEAAEAAVSCTL